MKFTYPPEWPSRQTNSTNNSSAVEFAIAVDILASALRL